MHTIQCKAFNQVLLSDYTDRRLGVVSRLSKSSVESEAVFICGRACPARLGVRSKDFRVVPYDAVFKLLQNANQAATPAVG